MPGAIPPLLQYAFMQCYSHLIPGHISYVTDTRVYTKVSGLTAWSEYYKLYSYLPLGAVVSLFYYESV
jgi:hypothetical protein